MLCKLFDKKNMFGANRLQIESKMGHSGYKLIGSLCEKWMNCKKKFRFGVGKFFAVWTW
jgi:hypothetical protein